MHALGGHVYPGGVHGQGCAWQGACVAREKATAVGSTYPTGMHSCTEMISYFIYFFSPDKSFRHLLPKRTNCPYLFVHGST